MAPNTGHLVNLAVTNLQPGYEVLPDELQGAARRVLQGRDEAYVSLTSGGKLSRWAAQRRKARRQMAKNSRKKNR
jgi:hypothetical protein